MGKVLPPTPLLAGVLRPGSTRKHSAPSDSPSRAAWCPFYQNALTTAIRRLSHHIYSNDPFFWGGEAGISYYLVSWQHMILSTPLFSRLLGQSFLSVLPALWPPHLNVFGCIHLSFKFLSVLWFLWVGKSFFELISTSSSIYRAIDLFSLLNWVFLFCHR